MEGSRRRQARAPSVARTIAAILKVPETQLADLDHDIGDAIRRAPAWREADNPPRSVPGVGAVASRTLIAEMPELGRLARAGPQPSSASHPSTATLTHARPQGHRGRPHRRSQHPLHGHSLRHPMQPRPPGPPRTAHRPRTPKDGRHRRMHATPPRHPQRDPASRSAMAARLAAKTVAQRCSARASSAFLIRDRPGMFRRFASA